MNDGFDHRELSETHLKQEHEDPPLAGLAGEGTYNYGRETVVPPPGMAELGISTAPKLHCMMPALRGGSRF